MFGLRVVRGLDGPTGPVVPLLRSFRTSSAVRESRGISELDNVDSRAHWFREAIRTPLTACKQAVAR
jgi:hypothetical protein